MPIRAASVTVQQALRHRSQLLAQGGCDEPALEAELLLTCALNLDRAGLYQRLTEEFPPGREAAYCALLERRLKHEPTPYILRHKEFYGLDFEVTPAAIIPRPETELLVELALAFLQPRASTCEFRIADVGTGCGAVAVALAASTPRLRVIATDLSADALALAHRNAERHRVAARVRFLQGDLLAPLDGPLDLIVANLPYVPTQECEALPAEIREHEPRGGLDGGHDGLRLIERLLRQAPAYLEPGGALFLEIGDEQAAAACALAGQAFPAARIEVERDLAGLDRVLVVRT